MKKNNSSRLSLKEALKVVWVYVRNEIVDYLGALVNTIGAAAVTIGAAWQAAGDKGMSWASEGSGRTILAGITATLVGCIIQVRQTKRTNSFARELDEARSDSQQWRDDYLALLVQTQTDYQTVFTAELRDIAKALELGVTERVSIYRDQGTNFTMTGRFSVNPEFRKPGRVVYPKDQGCIGRAWRDGAVYETRIPDPVRNAVLYANYMNDTWNIPAETALRFKMKSRCIAAVAVRRPSDDTNVAVVLFESTRPSGLRYKRIRSILDGAEGVRLARLIEHLKPQEPAGSVAVLEDF